MNRSTALLLLTLVTVGCDRIYGVDRSADVAFIPPPQTVLAIIRSTPGVDSVQYDHSRVLMGDTVSTFTYEGRGGVLGVIQFFPDAGGVHFIQYLQRFGTPPAQHQVDVTLPVMRSIEERLVSQAGLTGLRGVQQHCDERDSVLSRSSEPDTGTMIRERHLIVAGVISSYP